VNEVGRVPCKGEASLEKKKKKEKIEKNRGGVMVMMPSKFS
jgi:hypothetical protein